jgi:hypothetical protein
MKPRLLYVRIRSGRPRVVQTQRLHKVAELAGSSPFTDDLVVLEVHDGNNPVLNLYPNPLGR